MQLPPALGMRDARALTAQPVGGGFLPVLVTGHDLETTLVQVARLIDLHWLAQHPGAPGPAIGHVPDGSQGTGRPDLVGGYHPGCVVQQHAQAIRRRRRGTQRLGRFTERDQGWCCGRESEQLAPRH